MRVFAAVLALVIVASLAACGDDDAPTDASSAEPTAEPTVEPTAEPTAVEPTAVGDSIANLEVTREVLGLDTLVLEEPIEDGSHPVLSWQPVDGAASYWLVVHDAEGGPYWAWTGADTSVRLGGGDRAETNQTAALSAALTWSVLALDADGIPLAVSGEGQLAP